MKVLRRLCSLNDAFRKPMMDKSCLIRYTQIALPIGHEVPALNTTDLFQIHPNSFAKYNKGGTTVKTASETRDSQTFTTNIPHPGYLLLLKCRNRKIKLATHYHFSTFYMILYATFGPLPIAL